MPETVTLRIAITPELGPTEDVIREVRAGIEAVENSVAAERSKKGTRVIGRRRILEQNWKDSPTSIEPRRNRRPRFAGHLLVRIPALAGYRAFQYAYRRAREQWLAGLDALFPAGTYWLSRFARVAVEAN